jgi:hypothetical protein
MSYVLIFQYITVSIGGLAPASVPSLRPEALCFVPATGRGDREGSASEEALTGK